MKTTTRIPALALIATFALALVGCDAPEASDLHRDRDAEASLLRFSADEFADRLRAEGRDDEADALLETVRELPSADDFAAAPRVQAFKTAAECLVDYCMLVDPARAYSGQCVVDPHPLGMPGVCIIVDPGPGCEPFQWYGEWCDAVDPVDQVVE